MSTTPQRMSFGMHVAEHLNPEVSAETLENLYYETVKQPNGKSQGVLVGTPGLKLFTTPGVSGRVRGIHDLNGYLFAVIGNRLYRVSSAGVSTDLGHIAGSGRVRMAENGVHLWIATGDKLYAANESEILELPQSNFLGVADQDGYLLGVQGGGQKLFISGLDDATTIDPLDNTTADAFSDLVVGLISDHREPVVFKQRSIETYYNSGAAAFPFARSQVIERGCLAGDSIAKALNNVYFVGDDRQVYEMSGYQPKPISDHTITRLIEAEASPQTAIGFTYQQQGHTFYVLILDGRAMSFDIGERKWHVRKSDGLERWRVSAHCWVESWRKNIVGDYANGKLYELDLNTHDEDGETLRRRAVGSPLWRNGAAFIVDELFVDMQSGVGLDGSVQGSDPKASLDYSSDGGRTWSAELWRAMGKLGEYDRQAVWHRLGRHKSFTPRLTITDPVAVRIAGAYVRTTELGA